MSLDFQRIAILTSCAFAMVVLSGARAFADTYSLSAVAYTQSENFAGGDDFGNYTINVSDRMLHDPNYNCGGVINPMLCFETHYINSSTPVLTTAPPTLWNDPDPIAGTDSCALDAGSGFHAYRILCDNGHMIFGGFFDLPGGGDLRGIWSGSNPNLNADYLGNGSIDGGFMTANGNAFFIDGLHDSLDVALNLSATPVPEPGTLVLLGTGALSLMGIVRRRYIGA